MMRLSAAIDQPLHPFGLVTFPPLVNRLARDLIQLGQRADAFSLFVFFDHSDTLVHGSLLLPRHTFLACRCRELKLTYSNILLPMSSDKSVTHVPGLDPAAEPRPQGAVA